MNSILEYLRFTYIVRLMSKEFLFDMICFPFCLVSTAVICDSFFAR
jgi:hypothetical protein